jgi:cell division protein FtsI/penicillin-binding protein 2
MNLTQNSRFFSIGVLFSLIGALIFGQMVSIQNRSDIKDVDTFYKDYNDVITFTVIPERGAIYDRNGKLIAGSKEVYEVGIDFMVVKQETWDEEIATMAKEVQRITGWDCTLLLNVTAKSVGKQQYMRLADGVEPAQAEELVARKKELALSGKSYMRSLVVVPHLQRSYPEGSLAANVLGYVTSLDAANPRGVNGVEGRHNSYLAGTAVTVSIPRSPYDITTIPNIPSGASLILTLDREIQAAVEKIIDKATKDNGALSGTAIVLDPRTGEILAMASTPRINPNEYWLVKKELLDKKIPWNRAISQLYEPGSVFKPITIALAMDAGVITKDTVYNDRGFFDAPGKRILNWDGRAYGSQNITGCLQYSLNTCLSWVVNLLGEKKFYEGIKSFGIGQLSNVDLDGEDYYPVRLPGDENWTKLSLANNAFGQGVAVSPIQMISALSAIANDGKIMAPHILRAVIDKGRQYNNPPQVSSQPITAGTANTLSNMLAEAIQGESKVLKMEGYKIAGKTGTAEIPMPNGGYMSNQTNASFVGWGPVDDPRFMVYVWLEQPGGPMPFGSVIAAPVFKDIFMTCAQLTNLPPDAIRKQLTGTKK